MAWWDDIGKAVGDAWNGFTGQTAANNMMTANNQNVALAQQTNAANIAMQQETNAQNLALTREQWGREDTAVSRRSADLKAAGINPLLAAGSVASASPAARMEPGKASAPSVQAVPAANPLGAVASLVGTVTDVVRGVTDVQKTLADANLANLQGKKVGSETTGQDIANAFAGSMNPLKLTAMELENNLNNATLPAKVELVASQIRNVDMDTALKNIDACAKNAGIDLTNAQTLLAQANVKIAGVNLDIQQQELVSKLIAIKTAGLDYTIKQQMSKVNPGLAKGLGDWLDTLGKGQTFLRNATPGLGGIFGFGK